MINSNFSTKYNYEKLINNKPYNKKSISGFFEGILSRFLSFSSLLSESNNMISSDRDDLSYIDKNKNLSNNHSQKLKKQDSSYSLADNEKNSKLPTLLGGSQNSLHI